MSTINGPRRRKTRSSTVRQILHITPGVPPMTVDLCSVSEEVPSCIDLTNEPDDIVDLTLVNDSSSSIVCLGTVSLPVSTPVTLPVSSSRRSNRKRPAPVHVAEPVAMPRLKDSVFSTPEAASSRKSKSTANEQDPSKPKKIGLSCPICFDTSEMIQESNRQLVSTICGHIYCSTCLHAAIRSSHACPNCRKKLTVKQYHPIFI